MTNTLPENATERPWGWYLTTFQTQGYKTKIIQVYPGQRLSLQSHAHRKEMWSVVRGEGLCTVGRSVIHVKEDSFIFIPGGARHRMENTSASEPLVFAEVQIGDYLEEDDITRYEDDFGREDKM